MDVLQCKKKTPTTKKRMACLWKNNLEVEIRKRMRDSTEIQGAGKESSAQIKLSNLAFVH